MSDVRPSPDAVAWTDELVVRPSTVHGLGVFARRPFEVGEVIERVPCVIIPDEEMHVARMRGTIMHRYPMPGVPTPDRSAWMLGAGALDNHAGDPSDANAEWVYVGDRVIEFRAIRPIVVGDEIVYDYGEDTGF
ncbi:MAG: SET domain-containing protein-lysine N-methyltransferase [Ilumatobacteraceae bacterium]